MSLHPTAPALAEPFEVIPASRLEIWCDGGGVLGHPRVFLHIDSEVGQITCPYCSRTYLYKAA